MTDLRAIAQQALEALEERYVGALRDKAMDALRAALAQQEQEPVAWMYVGIKHDGTTHGPHLVWKPQYMDAMSAEKGAKATPLYTAPPRREWRGLSEDEIRTAYGNDLKYRDGDYERFARAIEAALKEKNNG